MVRSLLPVDHLTIISTILFAGHETTSNSLSWILLEIARHPKVQSRLRDEIREMEAAIRARGDTQFIMADLDAMPYTTAVIKVRGVSLSLVWCSDSLCGALTRKDYGITQ